MKINKWLFYISMIINVLLLTISTILYFKFKGDHTVSYIVSILLNIFAGSVILSITSLINYYICRRDLLRDIMNECLNFSTIFSNLKYFIPQIYNENVLMNDDNEGKKIIKKYKEQMEINNKENLKNIVLEYVKISEIGTNKLMNMYDDLDFVIDFLDKKKKNYWKFIFNYIYSKVEMIRYYSCEFKIYISDVNNNYEINEKYLCDLQDKIFFHKVYDFKKIGDLRDFTLNLDVGYEIVYDHNSKEITFIYNEVSDWLLKMFNKVGKDNYFNKNYSRLGSDVDE